MCGLIFRATLTLTITYNTKKESEMVWSENEGGVVLKVVTVFGH